MAKQQLKIDISGPSGIGKTAVLFKIKRMLEEQGFETQVPQLNYFQETNARSEMLRRDMIEDNVVVFTETCTPRAGQ